MNAAISASLALQCAEFNSRNILVSLATSVQFSSVQFSSRIMEWSLWLFRSGVSCLSL